MPGESTLRRDFLRLQLANKERSEALRRQQLEQQQRENEEHKRQLLAERQKRIEEQKEQRRRLEEVRTRSAASATRPLWLRPPSWVSAVARGPAREVEAIACLERTQLNCKGGCSQALLQAGDFPCWGWCDLGVVTSGKQVKAAAPSGLAQVSPS